MTAPHAFDARAILAEFPAGACQSHGRTCRAWDGFGNVGTGASWAEAADNLRRARAEREALVARLEHEADERRRALARWVGCAILWATLALSLATGFVETLTAKGGLQ